MIWYRRSTCNETDTELLVVFVGPYGVAAVIEALVGYTSAGFLRLLGYGKVRYRLL